MIDHDRLQALHRFVSHNRDEAAQMRLGMAAYLLDVARLELEKCLAEPGRSASSEPGTPPSQAGSREPPGLGS